jgi:hypothetical protein
VTVAQTVIETLRIDRCFNKKDHAVHQISKQEIL